MLEQIIGSKGRAAILRSLFDGRRQSVHIRELARISQLSAPSLMREDVVRRLQKKYPTLGLAVEDPPA